MFRCITALLLLSALVLCGCGGGGTQEPVNSTRKMDTLKKIAKPPS